MNRFKIGLAMVLSLGLAACGSATTPASTPGPTAQRLICPESLRSGCGVPDPDPTPSVILSPDTRILDNAVQNYDETSGVLMVTATPITSGYTVGNIVIGGVTPGMPVGVPPRRITNISPSWWSSGTLMISTQPASLPDAVQEGTLDMTQSLTVDNIAEEIPANGEVATALKGRSLLQAQKVDCSSTGNLPSTTFYSKSFSKDFAPATHLSGCTRVGTDLTLKLSIRNFHLDTFEASAKVGEVAKLELDLATVSTPDWEIDRIKFNPMVFMLGPVPIVVTPVIIFKMGVDGTVSANVKYTVDQEVSYKAGIEYSNGNLHPINQRVAKFEVGVPVFPMGNFTATGKAHLDVTPALNFWTTVVLATAQADVGATIRAYAKADVDAARLPVWQISAGAQFCISYNVRLDLLFGIVSSSWGGDRCGSELRFFERHSDLGPGQLYPSPVPSWNSVNLNFTNTYGNVEIYRTLPTPGAQSVKVAVLSSDGSIDLATLIPNGYQSDDVHFEIVSVVRNPGVFQSYRRSIDLVAFANGAPLWDPPADSCSGCHSDMVYSFDINMGLAYFQPLKPN